MCDELHFKNINFEKCLDSLYIKGTTRHFLKPEEYNMCSENEDEIIIPLVLKAAWGIEADALRAISQRYDIDFKIYAFEMGMEFNQDIEIVKGKIIKNEEIHFNNYWWECIDPMIGG